MAGGGRCADFIYIDRTLEIPEFNEKLEIRREESFLNVNKEVFEFGSTFDF